MPERDFGCCAAGPAPCYRSRPARWALLAGAVFGGGGAAAVIFGLGDRLAGADPGAALVGTSVVAGAGALLGMLFGRLGADRPGDPDRVRPATVGLEFGWGPEGQLDERTAPTLSALFAPQYDFSHQHGRVRLFGRVGGTLGPDIDVDPRPQFSDPIPGQDSSFPQTWRSRALAIDLGLDFAVRLPYPVLAPDRAVYWGPFELRYQPQVAIRRSWTQLGNSERVYERVMLLPLNVGFRWYFAPRQRFTMYAGPRFDFVNGARGDDELERSASYAGPVYFEAWYDLDVPFSLRSRNDGKPRRVRVNGLFSLGYVHSRFDGRGFNFGAVIGFLGPIHVAWLTRFRPRNSPVAWQLGVRAAIGIDTTVLGQFGVVLPTLASKRIMKQRRRER